MSDSIYTPEDETPQAPHPMQRTLGQRRRIAPDVEPRTAADVHTSTVAASGHPATPAKQTRDDYGYFDDGDVPRRKPLSHQMTNQFEVPRHLIKPGWDVQWISTTIYNQPVDSSVLVNAREAGWRPAKAKFFRELVDNDTADDAPVDRLGQRLYLRPMELTKEAQNEQVALAREALGSRTQATAQGRLVKGRDTGLSDMGGLIRPVGAALEVYGEMGSYASDPLARRQ